MNSIQFKTASVFLLVACSSVFPGCNYLDIIPDERVTEENTYQTPQQLKNYLYSCYGSIKRRNDLDFSVELLTANEICFYQKEPFSRFPEGNYSPTSPGLTLTNWSPVWEGIRRCHKFLSVADLTPNMIAEDLKYYKAEAKFLIAYYHFISLQNYGPTCIIDRVYDQNEPISVFPERSSYDEVVEFITKMIDESLPDLADQMTGNDFGRATKSAAWALKSRM
ncbi:MAG: RagB/SusD family nutrient uptake outer membrane protein, partial [Tannerellaceae bacterium]